MSSKESLYNPQNEEYLKYLTKADELRQLFSGLNEDDPLKDQSPTIIVVGMQTVGKSSVLGRISGIKFPSKDELCTRCATELRMRRCTENEDPSIIVTAIFDDDRKDEIMAQNPHINDMEKVIEETQAKIVGENSISEKGKILIEVTDHDVPIITLVDLPGIYQAKDGSSAEKEYATKVRSLAETKSSHENTLILHVIDSTNDTGNDATWEIVNGADKEKIRRITIATKLDRQESNTHLFKALDSCGGEIFGIIGNAEDENDEDEKFSGLRRSLSEHKDRDSIHLGLGALKNALETRMSRFLQEKIPKLRPQISSVLEETNVVLREIGESPKPAYLIASDQISETSKNLKEIYENDEIQLRLKSCIDTFVTDFKEVSQPIELNSSNMYDVYARLEGKIRPATFQENYSILHHTLRDLTPKIRETAIKFIESTKSLLLNEYFLKAIEPRSDSCKDVQVHVVKPTVTSKFEILTKKCKKRVEEILKWNLLGDVYSTNTHYLNHLIEKEKTDINRESDSQNQLTKKKELSKTFASEIIRQKMGGYMDPEEDSEEEGSEVSEPSNDSEAKALEADKNRRTKLKHDSELWREVAKDYEEKVLDTLISIRAFCKVQRKLLVDAIQNYVRQILLYEGQRVIEESQGCVINHLDKINDPIGIQKKRQRLLHRKKVCKQALTILDTY